MLPESSDTFVAEQIAGSSLGIYPGKSRTPVDSGAQFPLAQRSAKVAPLESAH